MSENIEIEELIHIINNSTNSFTIASACGQLGIKKYQLGFFNEAYDYLSKALLTFPNKITFLNFMGKVFIELGQYRNAERVFNKSISCSGNDTSREHFWLGKVYFLMGRYDEAEKKLLKHINLWPNSAFAWELLGKIYIEFERYEEAEQAFLNGVAADYEYITKCLLELGRLYKIMGKHKEGLSKLYTYQNKSAKFNPDAYLEFGDIKKDMSNYAEAIKYYLSYLSLTSDYSLVVHLKLGEVYRLQGDYDNAIKEYNKFIKLDCNDAYYGYFGIADVCIDKKCYKNAMQTLLIGIKIYDESFKPNVQPIRVYLQARLKLGKLYALFGRLAMAEEEFLNYMMMDEDFTPDAHLELGKIYVRQKKFFLAEEEFNRYIEINKDFTPDIHLELGKLYLLQKRYAEALDEFLTVKDALPNKSIYILSLIGKIYIQLGKYKEAIDTYMGVLAVYKTEKILLEISYAYRMLGEDEAAFSYLFQTERFSSYFSIDDYFIDKHIKKHYKEDSSKEIHSIFIKDVNIQIINQMIKDVNPTFFTDTVDVYNLDCPNIGYVEIDGVVVVFNHITINTLPLTKKVITAYPDFKDARRLPKCGMSLENISVQKCIGSFKR